MPTFCQQIFCVINFPLDCMAVSAAERPVYAHVNIRVLAEMAEERISLMTSLSPKLEILTILYVMLLRRLSSMLVRNSTLNSYPLIFHVITVHSLISQKWSFISSFNFRKCEHTRWSDNDVLPINSQLQN